MHAFIKYNSEDVNTFFKGNKLFENVTLVQFSYIFIVLSTIHIISNIYKKPVMHSEGEQILMVTEKTLKVFRMERNLEKNLQNTT